MNSFDRPFKKPKFFDTPFERPFSAKPKLHDPPGMSTKVCHLTSVHGPHDIRIFQKMCVSLAAAGYEVYLVVANAESEVKDGVHIIGVDVPFAGRLSRMRKAAKAVYREGLELDAEIYHVHDPELIPFAVRLQNKGKKVIFDSHEDVPRDILGKSWLGPVAMRKLTAWIYNSYEKLQVRKLSGVISVVDSITAKFRHPYGDTIHNYPRLDLMNTVAETDAFTFPEKMLLVHHGGLSEMRGTHFMIAAMDRLDDGFRLVLMGPWENDAYRSRCASVPGWDKVLYQGQLDMRNCMARLKHCHLGLVLLRPFPSYKQSLPIKAFEYIGVPVPMLMSDFPFWRQEFGDYARFVDPENPEAIAQKIAEMAENYVAELAKVRIKSPEILASKTWKSEEKKLLEFYKNLP